MAFHTFANDTESGKTAKALIQHGDITALSIYANSLVEKAKNVVHGVIREVSIVIAGANPGRHIDNLAFEHADGSIVKDETEAIICAGVLAHDTFTSEESDNDNNEDEKNDISHAVAEEDPETVGKVFETFDAKQKSVVYALIAHALDVASADEEEDEEDDKPGKDGATVKHSNNKKGEPVMKKNIFDKNAQPGADSTLEHGVLSREELRNIFSDAIKSQSTLKNAFAHGYESLSDALAAYEHQEEVLAHAGTYGIDNIGYLFPRRKDPDQYSEFYQTGHRMGCQGFRRLQTRSLFSHQNNSC